MSHKSFSLSSDVENDGVSTPSSPDTGKFKLYFKSDGNFYSLNDAGIESLFSAQKQYVVGTGYTNGTPSVTSSAGTFVVVRGVLIPYQTANGAWRLKGNYTATHATVTSRTDTISGITTKNVAGYYQSAQSYLTSNTNFPNISIQPNDNDLLIDPAGNFGGAAIHFDWELESKPTWAD